jgi:hypothetical protein
MTKPTAFPLPLRNALAELAIAALEEDDAAAALAWLAAPADGPPSPAAAARLVAVHLIDPGASALLDVHRPWTGAVAEHARRASAAAAAHRLAGGRATAPLACAIAHGIALWNARLFFEVHEVLEAVWRTATGDVRLALQGVIQLAVAFHHLAHGNRRGARSLLAEGGARLGGVPPGTLPGLEVAALRQTAAEWEKALAAGGVLPEEPPRLG